MCLISRVAFQPEDLLIKMGFSSEATFFHPHEQDILLVSENELSHLPLCILTMNRNRNMQHSMTAPGLDMGRAMTWMFKSPNWIVNLFWMFLCGLLGTVIIGSLVAFGYQFEIIQRRSYGRTDEVPDFDSGRFADYLIRGRGPS